MLRKYLKESKAKQQAELSPRQDLNCGWAAKGTVGERQHDPEHAAGECEWQCNLKESLSVKENIILEQNEQIAHFYRKVWELEESLKEKNEIISASETKHT